jgi:ubiquinone/menaquinone biosynthesis C-methylase UbiE
VNGKIPWNADLYDLNETAVDDVEFAIMLIGATPRKVLEIACGSGRFRFLWQRQDIAMATPATPSFSTATIHRSSTTFKIEEKITDEKITWHKADVIRDNWGTEHCSFRHWRQGD